ncbi:MAG: hypothetical protein U1F16_10155 [Turneriella sp.]
MITSMRSLSMQASAMPRDASGAEGRHGCTLSGKLPCAIHAYAAATSFGKINFGGRIIFNATHFGQIFTG